MEQLEKKLDKYIFVICLLLSIPAIWALFVPGYFGASDDLHIAWLFEMDKAIRMFQIPPRFVPDLSFGFGYPLFNFVFPLPFYIGEVLHLLGLSLVSSIKGVFLLSVPLSMFFMYKLLKEFTTLPLSLAGAVLYIYTPYRATDLYVRGAIGEIFSFVFLPLIVLSFFKLAKANLEKENSPLRWVGIGGLSIAGLILTHNITAYMFFAFLAFLVLILLFIQRRYLLQNLKRFGLAFSLGLLASSFFWLPAIKESSLVSYDTVFNFIDHFPTIKQLMTPYFGYGASVPGPGDGMSFFIGMVNLLLVVISTPFLAIFWKKFSTLERILVFWSVLVFFLSFFMMNYRATFLWESLPLIGYFQFPWRFLIITTFCTPLLVVALKSIPYSNKIGFLLIVVILLLNFSSFRPQDFLGRTDDYYLQRYIPTPETDELYFEHQEEYLRLPKDSQTRPDKIYPRVYPESERISQMNIENDLNASFETDFLEPAVLNYNKYFFPDFKVKINGENTTISPGYPFGQISFTVPAGKHTVKVYYQEGLYKKILNIISLLSIILAFLFIIGNKSIYRYLRLKI